MSYASVLPVTIMFAWLGLVAPARATQPPDVVQSDSARNTAMGAATLLDITTGYQNTAAGSDATLGNTTGFKNAAFGFAALSINGQEDRLPGTATRGDARGVAAVAD